MRFTKRFFDIQSEKLNYSFQNDFIAGFTVAAPENYDPEIDAELSDPWNWPFTIEPDLVLYGSTAFDAGYQYAKSIYSILQEYLEAE